MEKTLDDTAERVNDEYDSARMTRRAALASGAMLTTSAIGGCLGLGDSGDGNGDPTNIAIISSDAGFGDRAFNDLAVDGLETAQEEYNIELNQIEETDVANFGDAQAAAAESNDLVVLVGFQHTEDLQENAPEFPDTHWMLINDNVEEDNVAGYVWANHEMSYLAGVQAGTMTSIELQNGNISNDPDNNHIGFVGGVEGPLIKAFERSYIAGAESVDSDIEISTGYAGSFSDPAAGEDVASSQYDAGADIIYHASAGTGPGIFQAAQAEDRFAIGVDADQSRTLSEYSDVIIGSAVKYINTGTYDAASAVAEDNFESIQGFNRIGLEEEAVDLVIGQEFEGDMPDELSSNIEDAKEGIVDGDIDVPCSHTGCQS
jgi:basic membrane protein A